MIAAPIISNLPNLDAPSLRPATERAIHDLFEEQAATRPDSPAVLFNDQVLSYGRLNERANRLAHRLTRSGVTRGALVGLCLERCPEVLVGLLGIFKAGAAYVPLDPAYPDERLAFMLRDTAAPVVLAHAPTAARLSSFARQTDVLCLGPDDTAMAAEPDLNPAVGVTGPDVAYVMYTSGSTGQPKGVSVCHRGVVRLVRGADYCDFGRPGQMACHPQRTG
jgi:non-ribosomal peptide synthetase component F